MKTTELKLYRLELGDVRTWLAAAAFVAGNIILPQLLHLLPGGGVRFLPIYFFTLVGAYKYGWRAGLLTALISPMLNSLLFGMPAVGALPVADGAGRDILPEPGFALRMGVDGFGRSRIAGCSHRCVGHGLAGGRRLGGNKISVA